MPDSEMFKTIVENGIIGTLFIFLVWWTAKTAAKREQEMGDRIEALETRLLNLLESVSMTLGRSADVIENNNKALDKFTEVCIERCLRRERVPTGE